MLIQNSIISPDDYAAPDTTFPNDAVFFDIETTGLSHRASHLYMIGAVYPAEGKLRLIQWFLQRPSEEKEALQQFSDLLHQYGQVIHYNGQSFDIPYLKDRCRYWELPDPFGEQSPISLDLYRELRHLKKIFQLSSIKQKDLEVFLQLSREDEMSGKDLIQVYHRYLEQAGDRELQLLLLHNRDDLTGMLGIYSFYAYLCSLEHISALPEYRILDDTLQIELTHSLSCPTDLTIRKDEAVLVISRNRITLSVQGISGTFKHYYSNYRDYYYLPLEDTAIHKSVGAYVDPHCRQKAKADTCYTKKEGLFFYQPSPVFLPDFRMDARKGPSYFSAEQPEQNPEFLREYVSAFLSHLFFK